MPGGDGTGPVGLGPMTGRAAGYCAGYPVPGFMNPVWGGGSWGWHGGFRGRGRGFRERRNWFWATGSPGGQRAAMGWPGFGAPWGHPPAYGYPAPAAEPTTAQQEIDFLTSQADYFEDALEGIKKRLDELQAQAETEEK